MHPSTPMAMSAPPPAMSSLTEWVTLADACRVTNRSDSTIKGWIASGLLRQPDEARSTTTPQGTGYVWAISLPALERVHRAKGGLDWRPENVRTKAPAHLAEEMARLRAAVAALEQQNRELAAQLGALREGGLVRASRPVTSLAESGYTERADLGEERAKGLPALPAGWRSLSNVNNAHGLGGSNASIIRNSKGFMAAVVKQGPWWYDTYQVRYALDEEGQREYGRKWRANSHFLYCNQPDCLVDQAARAAALAAMDGAAHERTAETLPEHPAIRLTPGAAPMAVGARSGYGSGYGSGSGSDSERDTDY